MKIARKADVYVYIAGKYTDKTTELIEEHINAARTIAIECADRNILFFCPHTHTAHFDEYSQNESWQYYMNICEPVLRKVCNVIVMVPNWEDSKGAKYEFNVAQMEGYMCFTTFEEFSEWYETLPT